MPYFIDIDQISIRGGDEAFKFGDPYTSTGIGKVEHDRYLYISNLAGESGNLREALKLIELFGEPWGWRGVRWERLRKNKTHLVEFKYDF